MSLPSKITGGPSATFPGGMEQATQQSRLMHGVGIASLGFLMDTIFDRYIRV